MTRQAGSDGGSRTRTSRRPRRTVILGCPTVLVVAIFGAYCAGVGNGFSSNIACPIDIFSCLGDDECSSCLNLLQDTGLSLGGVEFELCGELYADMCVTIDSIGCNTQNDELEDLLTCVLEDQFGCDDFTTCDEVTAGLIEATEAPAATTTGTPAATPATATPSPVAPTVPTFPTPVFPLPTAAPSPGSRGIFSPPTAAPTAGGSGTSITSFPSPAMFEGTADTMAPSESSAAPTGFDGLRGGIGSAFSAAPTAAPTGFESLDDLEDGANGGISSRHIAGPAARSLAFAAVLGFVQSALAALAV